MFNLWASGFCACGAVIDLIQGRYWWSLPLIGFAIVNYFLGRERIQKALDKQKATS